MNQIDSGLDALAAAQALYVRRDAYEAAHEALRQQLDALRSAHVTDASELRMAISSVRSRLAGASAALVVAVTLLTTLMAVFQFLR